MQPATSWPTSPPGSPPPRSGSSSSRSSRCCCRPSSARPTRATARRSSPPRGCLPPGARRSSPATGWEPPTSSPTSCPGSPRRSRGSTRAWTRKVELGERHLLLWERHLAGIAATLAGELTHGRPCSVCGSETHPHPAQDAADPVLRSDVQAARVAAGDAALAVERLTRARDELDRDRATLVGRIGGSDVEALRDLHHEAEAAVALATAARDREPALASRLADLTGRHDRLAADRATASDEENAARHALQARQEAFDAAEASVLAARQRPPERRRPGHRAGQLRRGPPGQGCRVADAAVGPREAPGGPAYGG